VARSRPDSAHQTHERFSREDELRPSSERTFGLVLGAVFTLIGLGPLWRGAPPRWGSLAAAAALFATARFAPRILAPLNRLWFKLGLVLHAVLNPIVMALLFFTTVTPIALIMRAMGNDPLRLRPDPDAPTYWNDRQPPGPEPGTMPRQF
jgi:hypothetical protein